MTALIERAGKDLTIMGHQLAGLVERFGLPLHVIWEPVIRSNIRAFQQIFKETYPKGQIRFAAKAYTHPAIFGIMKEEGVGADVASTYEARCAIESGIPPVDLDLNGNCKEDSLIKKAIDLNMLIVADSFEELRLIDSMAAGTGKKPRVILRLSGYDLGKVTSESVFTAGVWTKFGAPVDEVPSFIGRLGEFGNVDFLGFHTHIGSQIANPEPYRAVLGKLIEMGLLLKQAGRPCRIINIGGGYPVSYMDKAQWLQIQENLRKGYEASRCGDMSQVFTWGNDMEYFEAFDGDSVADARWTGEKFYTGYPKAEMVQALLTGEVTVNGETMPATKALDMLVEPTLVIEPGRSIIEDSGVTLARVSIVRTIAGEHNLVTVEMGVMSHASALIQSLHNRWEVANDFEKKDPSPFRTFVAGNLCFSGDMLARLKISLQRKPERGDILLIHDTGAYTSHFAASNANSFPRPARILVDARGEIRLLKKRDTYEDIFA